MKNIITSIAFLIFFGLASYAQTFEIRIIENDFGYLEVQMKETSGTGTPTTSTPVTDISFEIRWLSSLSTDVGLLCASNPYDLLDGLGSIQTEGSYNWRLYNLQTAPLYPPVNWVQNQWEPIGEFKAFIGNGSGTFEIAPDGWVAQGLNWSQGSPSLDYTPTVNGSADNYPYPTLVYDYVWVGGATNLPLYDGSSWSLGANWKSECGTLQSLAPLVSSNCIIPGGLTFYPNNVDLFGVFSFTCNNLRILPGAHVNIPKAMPISGKLDIVYDGSNSGQLIVPPLGQVTVTGATDIQGPQGITVVATASGVGSFRDNGTITYGSSGSATVETFLLNTAAPGSYYAHLVGPTINDPALGFSGVNLDGFDVVNLGTYAYEYIESTNSWNNIYSLSTPVPTAKGLLMSTVDATNHTISMSGELITGTLVYGPLPHTGNNLDLLSNPYPSALDFIPFYNTNSTAINNVYRVWDGAGSGNYFFYSTTGGGALTKDIQVGQGFFVETINPNPVTFDNTMRVHSNAAFLKSTITNQLRLDAEGDNGFKDATFIYFNENGTYGFDIMWDVYKWWSMMAEATELWTVDGDQSYLSMNTLPPLGIEMVSVPMSFKCGEDGEYTITASQIASFQNGTEIWLEDLIIGGPWHSFIMDPVYTFEASVDDPEYRFLVHFFGPTGINDPDALRSIKIYGYGQDAYIVNRGNETVKEYIAYDMMGRELHRGTLPNSTVNKITIGNVNAYYIVKVITKEGNVYTDKVYISQ